MIRFGDHLSAISAERRILSCSACAFVFHGEPRVPGHTLSTRAFFFYAALYHCMRGFRTSKDHIQNSCRELHVLRVHSDADVERASRRLTH